MNYLHTDAFLIILFILNIALLIWSVISNIRIKNIHKKDKIFMEKLGDGKNIKEDLERYMDRVATTEEEVKKLSLYYKDLDQKTKNCLQKVGIVRYNAYEDTGSDLSFAVCLLDEQNNGVVLNGIYSRDMSNIYAKPIKNGESKYKMTPEEQEALSRAISN